MTNTPEDSNPTGDLNPRDPAPTGDFDSVDAPAPAPAPVPSPAPGGAIERPGDSIGPYKLLEVIGEGGFGVVYLAERREPMVQRVALKVIKPGMDSKAVVARFEQERQALAVMDHPNVARVFDGGVTASGRPYFVMEYVKGETLTAYADRKRLTLRERLELFIPICEAVQHAHHKGLIRRDLKPSNVLVAEVEGKPAPKVIDFGVAKAMAGEGWTDTAHTQSGVVIGTPLYMSPEQVAGETDVDTRADVYSLGVMLYELLTGEVPFDPGVLRKAALAEIQRIIREVTPPKPSTRVAQLADVRTTALAVARSASRERIAGELRRELDWIPLMALRKERERRYASPQALADDVRRYLDGRPLRAAPDSKAYLARKFVRRNRVQVLAAAVVFLALTAGLVVALWQRNEAIRAKDAEAEQRAEAESQRTRADERADAAERAEAAATAARDAEKERADQLKKVSDFQSQMLSQIDATQAGIDLMKDVRERFVAALEKAGVPEADRTTRVDALQQELVRVNATDAAAAMIDRTILKPAIKTIDEQFKDDPATDASLRQALVDLYRTIGLYDAAMPLQESALATRRRVLGDDHRSTIVSTDSMGMLLQGRGKPAEAEALFREAIERFRRTRGEQSVEAVSSLGHLGALLQSQGKLSEAEDSCRQVMETRRSTLGESHPDTLRAISNYGTLLQYQGKLQEAEPYCREALEKRRAVLGDDDPGTLDSINNLGSLLHEQGRLAEAEPLFREALERSRRVLGDEHPLTLVNVNNMGFHLQGQGRLAEAEPYFVTALEARRRVLGPEHPSTLESVQNLSVQWQLQGKSAQAEPLLRDMVDICRRSLGESHPDTLAALNALSGSLSRLGKFSEAEGICRTLLDKRRALLGEEHPDTLRVLNNLGVVLENLGELAEAELLYRRALETRIRVLGAEHPDALNSANCLGVLLRKTGMLAEAEPILRDVLQKRRVVLGVEHPETINSAHNYGALLRAMGRLDEAAPYLRDALEKRQRLLGLEHPDTLVSATSVGRVLAQRHESQQALDLITPFEPAARKRFAGGNAPRLAEFLFVLGRARFGVGYDAGRYALAESNLLEAHPIHVAAKDRGPAHKDTLACVQALVDLYAAWDKAEPGKGYDARAAEWQAKLSPPKAD